MALSNLEQEKKIRREIANSNERRRMQSINAGFNSLRTMLPKHDGEKLSKAAILQHTAEYIYQLEQDKTKLLQEISQLKRLVLQEYDSTDETPIVSAKKVKIETIVPMETNNSDSSDEGIQCYTSSKDLPVESGDASRDELRNELIEVRKILDKERRLRMQLEDQVRSLEAQIYPEKIKEIANQVQLQFQRVDGETLQAIDETTAAVSSVVSDEIAETIEIETDCPDSPLQSTIVIQATPCSPTSIGTNVTIETPQDLTAKSLKQNSKTSSKSPQPAAIALPIDVPFIGTDNGNGEGQTVTVQIIGLSDVASSSSAPRHNLDTIVQAIRHLEGDHLFRDEEENGKGNGKIKALTVTTTASMVNNNNNIVNSNNDGDDKAIKTVTLTPSIGATLRQQVIHSLPIQSRPGVIVANRA